MSLTLHAFTCGWFQSPLTFFLGGEDRRIVRSPVPAYLIDHPKGRALFDTGLGLRFRHPIEERLPTDATGFEFDESADIGFEFPDRGMNTSLEPLSGEFSEPALDLIDP